MKKQDKQTEDLRAALEWLVNLANGVGKSGGEPNCISLVTEMGWPEPPRSSCWMCPQMNHLEWQDLRDHNPQDFAKAVAFDKKLRERDPGVFVHRSGTPLDEADLDYDDPGERGLFACLGGCFT